MDSFAIKLCFLVLCIAWHVEGQMINKIDKSINDRVDLYTKLVYRRADMAEIRSLIRPYFVHLGEHGKEKYREWFEENRNGLNDQQRRIQVVEDELGTVELYQKTTDEEIKKFQDLHDSAKPDIPPRSAGLLQLATHDRLRAIGERVALLRAESHAGSAELRVVRVAHAQADGRLAQSRAILQAEQSAGARRTRESGALGYRTEQTDSLYTRVKEKADELLEMKKSLQDQLAAFAARKNEIEAKIKEIALDIQKLKTTSNVPVAVPSTVPTGLNYITSVKTASGRGNRIRLVIVSD